MEFLLKKVPKNMLTDAEIIPAFHQLIDEVEQQPLKNKQYLKELYDSIAGLLSNKGDILDGLTPYELDKTQKSILEVQSGKTTSDEIVRKKIAQKWNIR
jgi:hypothetical protein